MTEPQLGVFVSRLSNDDWEPDPDVGGLMQILCDIPGVWAGFTRYSWATASGECPSCSCRTYRTKIGPVPMSAASLTDAVAVI